MRPLLFTCALALALAAPLSAQTPTTASPSTVPTPDIPPTAKTMSLAGPRFGFTFLSDGVVQKLADRTST